MGRRATARGCHLLPQRGATDAPRKPEAVLCSSPRVVQRRSASLWSEGEGGGVAFVSPASRWQHPSPSSAPPKVLQAVCYHCWESWFNFFPMPTASSPTQLKWSLSYPIPSCLTLRGHEPAVLSRWLPLGQHSRGQPGGTCPGYRVMPQHRLSNRVWGFLASPRGPGSPCGSAPRSCCHLQGGCRPRVLLASRGSMPDIYFYYLYF